MKDLNMKLKPKKLLKQQVCPCPKKRQKPQIWCIYMKISFLIVRKRHCRDFTYFGSLVNSYVQRVSGGSFTAKYFWKSSCLSKKRIFKKKKISQKHAAYLPKNWAIPKEYARTITSTQPSFQNISTER